MFIFRLVSLTIKLISGGFGAADERVYFCGVKKIWIIYSRDVKLIIELKYSDGCPEQLAPLKIKKYFFKAFIGWVKLDEKIPSSSFELIEKSRKFISSKVLEASSIESVKYTMKLESESLSNWTCSL